ncbi:MAG: hypothetical protein IKT94_05390 [Rikenellaceae bacterium]|nr:hypothetical protein [Rikenellaceae bacterium]
MRRRLLMLLSCLAMLSFTSCDIFQTDEVDDKVITQGDIAGSWDYIYSNGFVYGAITIDKYGNFEQVYKGSGVTSLPEDMWEVDTGTIIIAGGKATITYDGYEESHTYTIKASKMINNRWLLDPYSNGMAYMAFGDCGDLGMFGSGSW